MKIAILGGTGNIGKGLALRLAQHSKHEIVIGSRKRENANKISIEIKDILYKTKNIIIKNIRGEYNTKAILNCEIIILALRYENMKDILLEIYPFLNSGQIILSVVVPMIKKEENGEVYFDYLKPKLGSAAKEIESMIPTYIDLVAAFHNISARKLEDISKNINFDVIVCGNSQLAKSKVMNLIKDINNLNPLDIGSLNLASLTEPITPLLLNISLKNKNLKNAGIKFET